MISRNPLGRKPNEHRPLEIKPNVNRYAEGSVLITLGETHVLCTASIEDQVPEWMKGKNQGWVTGEYNMLPRSTHSRKKREREKVSGRTLEIQRLIGRSLRACVNLKKIGERSITIDCDVIQADGGTRTASVTGGCVALAMALGRLIKEKKADPTCWVETVSAISLGFVREELLVDLDYNEDSTCEADLNVVFTESGKLVEIQGTAEKAAFSIEQLQKTAQQGLAVCQQIHAQQKKIIKNYI